MGCFNVKFIGSMRNKRTNQRRIANRDPAIVGINGDHEIPVKMNGFRWEELKKASNDFSNLIGSGGLSNVYLANFSFSTLAAVKIIQCGGSERLSRIFRQELEISRQVQHENIVKLIGFSETQEEGALIFEYIPNGTLQEKLHNHHQEVLSWKSRMVIAFQLAGAIQYLHDNCSLHIIHGDIKPSNILLDQGLNCKLCDFGSAKMGFSSMVLPTDRNLIMGSPGYVDPQLLRTGIASKKSDVYSFGVIILELITGMEAFCPEKGRMLTAVIGTEVGNAVEMVDPSLEGNFVLEEVKAMSLLAGLCLKTSPVLRPSMSDILLTMKDKITWIYNDEKVYICESLWEL